MQPVCKFILLLKASGAISRAATTDAQSGQLGLETLPRTTGAGGGDDPQDDWRWRRAETLPVTTRGGDAPGTTNAGGGDAPRDPWRWRRRHFLGRPALEAETPPGRGALEAETLLGTTGPRGGNVAYVTRVKKFHRVAMRPETMPPAKKRGRHNQQYFLL